MLITSVYFPNTETGVSLYANLPHSFEGEVGYRQLYFTDNIWMYTASLGKYYQNFWFNLKTYLTPSNENISQSYAGTVRYYTKGTNDYLGFIIGTGLSPEENRSNLLDMSIYKLKTFKVGAEYNLSINQTNLFSLSSTYYNQEYKPGFKGNQLDVTLGYIKTF
ncbi:YaiO family outer membrane beta-barrel protein [Sphingobacterium sp. SG20118]|uniref:YaiO family outer membrane beta-barrel protein n=1 Tax=Sphingobacterium sp. SG20118 TaxID=3367156 RepID=UPI0037DFC4C9